MGVVSVMEITAFIKEILKEFPELKCDCDDLLQMWAEGGRLKSDFAQIELSKFLSFFEEKNVQFTVTNHEVSFESISALNLCLFLQHYVVSFTSNFSYRNSIWHALLVRIEEMIVECEALEKKATESEALEEAVDDTTDETSDTTNIIKLMRVNFADINEDTHLETTVRLVTGDAFEKLQDSHQMIKYYSRLQVEGPVTQNLFVRNDFFEKLPLGLVYAPMYLKKDDGFILSEKMLFRVSPSSDVYKMLTIVGADESGPVCEVIMMHKNDYDKIKIE